MAVRDYIFRNFWAKLLSVVFATLLWMTISVGKENGWEVGSFWRPTPFQRLVLERPVHLLGRGGEHGDFSLEPNRVTIIIEGSAMALKRLEPGEVRAFVDLSTAGASESSRKRPVRVFLPPGIGSVTVGAEPDEVRLEPQAPKERHLQTPNERGIP